MNALLDSLSQLEAGLLQAAREQAGAVYIDDGVYGYIRKIAGATRQHPFVDLGISTRGLVALVRCARALAAVEGSEFVSPDHIKSISAPLLNHRLVLTQDAILEGITTNDILQDILNSIEVPRD